MREVHVTKRRGTPVWSSSEECVNCEATGSLGSPRLASHSTALRVNAGKSGVEGRGQKSEDVSF